MFAEKVKGEYQGAVFRFTQGIEAGVNRVAWGPDGALYIGGIGNPGNWSHAGGLWYGLQRMKFNENPTFEMLAVRAKSNGMEIELTEALQEGQGGNAADYEIKQWRFEPSPEYGGPKLDEKVLKILSVNVSEDRKKVFLELEGMKEKHMVYVRLKKHFVSANGNELWASEAWYNLNQIPENQAGFTSKTEIPADNTLTASEKAEGWELLFDGKTTEGLAKLWQGNDWQQLEGGRWGFDARY